MEKRQLIGGQLVEGEGEALAVLDPATGEEVARVAEASPEQVDAAVQAAEEAFEAAEDVVEATEPLDAIEHRARRKSPARTRWQREADPIPDRAAQSLRRVAVERNRRRSRCRPLSR